MSHAAGAPAHGSPPGPAIALVAAAGVLSAMTHTLLIPVVPTLAARLDTDPATASWAVTMTLLAAAVSVPIAGRAADLYGKRRVIVVSLALLALGSALCAIHDDATLFILGRGMQGIASCCVPVGISLLRDILPTDRLPTALAVVSASIGAGSALSLPVAGFLADHVGWQAAFWALLVCAGTLAVVIHLVMPASHTRPTGRFDWIGAAGLSALVALVLLVISGSAALGPTAARATVVAGVILLPLWCVQQLRRPDPLVDLRVSTGRPLAATNIATALAGYTLYANALSIPVLMQLPTSTGHGLGLSMGASGLFMAPGGILTLALAPVNGRFIRRHGSRTALSGGLVLIVTGYLTAASVPPSLGLLVMVSCVNGVGIGVCLAAIPGLVLRFVPQDQSAAAMGLNALVRSFGTSVAGAAVPVILMSAPALDEGTPSLTGFSLAFGSGALAGLAALVAARCIPRGS